MARSSKPVAQPKAVIPDHSRSHRVAPAHIVDRHTERRSQSLTFIGTRSPSTNGNRFDSFGVQLGPLGDVFDRQSGFLKQQINGSYRQDEFLAGLPDW